MAGETLPQSLGFLTDAAHLLLKTAPETSAYLMMQRNSLMFHNELEISDLQRQHVCGACGHIMIPGRGSELNMETRRAVRKKKAGKKKNVTSKGLVANNTQVVERRKRFTCGMCHRYTDISLPPAPPITRRRPPKLINPLGSGVTQPNAAARLPEPAKLSANASSKKRAKSRKQGLQALLQQAQSSATRPQNGFGLSLSDFMLK